MIEALGTILAAISAIVAVVALIVGYVIWRSNRRMDDAAAKAARKASGGKGEE
jgi:heme/copper-type cytochrome/quinol oxidase subunit 2